MANTECHIGIIGAGLGGLAAAIGIARSGHKVTIIEQAPVLGEVSSLCYTLDRLAELTDDRSELAYKFRQTRREFSRNGASSKRSKTYPYGHRIAYCGDTGTARSYLT